MHFVWKPRTAVRNTRGGKIEFWGAASAVKTVDSYSEKGDARSVRGRSTIKVRVVNAGAANEAKGGARNVKGGEGGARSEWG